MTPTNLPHNFPQRVLTLFRRDRLDELSADEIRRRMKAGADTQTHFDALCRQNRAKQLNAMLEG